MKVTQVFGFTPEEIEALKAAGKILGELATAYTEPSEDAKVLDETTTNLVAALKEVLGRIQ